MNRLRTWMLLGALASAACGGSGDSADGAPPDVSGHGGGDCCVDDIDAAPTADAPVPDATVPDATAPVGPRTHLVSSVVRVPTSSAQALALAFDLDLDPASRPDNALGSAFAAMSAQGLDVELSTQAAVAAGQLVTLHVVQAPSLTGAAHAFWSVFEGAAHPAPDFSGAGTFKVEPAAPTDSLLAGAIVDGRFEGGPGNARVKVFIGATPVVLDLVGAHVTAQLGGAGCTAGKIGGGVRTADVQTQLVPALAIALTGILHADAGCPAHCTGTAATVESLFDGDHDGTITATEVGGNAILHSLLTPDLDLLDAEGRFHPHSDGVKDTISLGLGFTCVGAAFTAPGE